MFLNYRYQLAGFCCIVNVFIEFRSHNKRANTVELTQGSTMFLILVRLKKTFLKLGFFIIWNESFFLKKLVYKGWKILQLLPWISHNHTYITKITEKKVKRFCLKSIFHWLHSINPKASLSILSNHLRQSPSKGWIFYFFLFFTWYYFNK